MNTRRDITGMTDSAGRSYAYGYTDDVLTSSTMPDGAVTRYAYDSTGQLTKITSPAGRVTLIDYFSVLQPGYLRPVVALGPRFLNVHHSKAPLHEHALCLQLHVEKPVDASGTRVLSGDPCCRSDIGRPTAVAMRWPGDIRDELVSRTTTNSRASRRGHWARGDSRNAVDLSEQRRRVSGPPGHPSENAEILTGTRGAGAT